ncbi:hypothetical protein F5Y10DRAFT_255642 [Nemania abortiva]|nr:hypothetical protein F5Y10DRAFT_255642 [Nemania abortiva]
MQANQIHRVALSDASGRANLSPARPVGTKPANGPAIPSFPEFMAMTNAKQPATKTIGPPSRPATAAAAAAVPKVPVANANAKVNAPKAATSGAAGSKKRKAENTLEEDIAAYKQNLDHIIHPNDIEDDVIIASCQVVRGRINKLIDSGIMTKTEFTKTIGAGTRALNSFMRASSTVDNMSSAALGAYFNAWKWFYQREVAKIKMPDVKKRQMLEADAGGKPGAKSKTVASLPDISDIRLPGEEVDGVEVYDTCDEVRRKINAHLKTPGLTQAQFCRDLYAQLHAPRCKSIQSKQLSDFRALKGSRSGAKSTVFYAAYVYFEKLRIAQNKPKTAHRVAMEDIWESRGGFDRENDHRTSYIMLAGESITCDQFGLTRTGYF